MDYDEQKRQLELDKLKAEISKTNAEEQEIKKRSKDWNKKTVTIIQTVVGAIIAAGLLATWIVEYFEPVFNRENRLYSLNNQIEEKENKIRVDSLQNIADSLLIVKEKILESSQKLAISQSEMEKILTKLTKDYNELSKDFTEKDKERLKLKIEALNRSNESANIIKLYGWLIKGRWSFVTVLGPKSWEVVDCYFNNEGKFVVDYKTDFEWKINNSKLELVNSTDTIISDKLKLNPELIILKDSKGRTYKIGKKSEPTYDYD